MPAKESLRVCWFLLAIGLAPCRAGGEQQTVPNEIARVRATANVWLSDSGPRQRRSSAGKATKLKLKNLQDLALIRFDLSAVRGREVLGATLFLRRVGEDKLRYLRISTVNQDWEEGDGTVPYGPSDGATFLMADGTPRIQRPWAWPGSTVADVIMSAGNSLGCWAERKATDDGWMAVELTPALVYALAVGDSDGLAVMDGGNPANHDNFVSSAQDPGHEPYLVIRLSGPLTAVPAAPAVRIAPAPDRAHLESGAMRVAIDPAENVFCWQLQLNGKPVDRWQVKHPRPGEPTVLYLEGLEPNGQQQLEIRAISSGGRASPVSRASGLASPALGRLSLGPLDPPRSLDAAPREAGPVQVWALPGLVKISPIDPTPMANDLDTVGPAIRADATVNSVWDGRQVYLFGARGEYVSFQLCVQNADRGPLTSIQVRPQPLAGPDGEKIGPENVELFWNWYARNRQGQWQPAYCIPMEPGTPLGIPQSDRRLPEQRNQTIYVDLYIPKDAKPGSYTGAVLVSAAPGREIEVPVILDVLNFTLPDRLSFWPELSAYRIPANAVEYYRLAHEHRCVLNCMSWRPKVTGQGRDAKVQWEQYDRRVGPLLTGEAFARNRRSGVPVECMYLPFDDSWPTPLSPETYHYSGSWPKQGDSIGRLVEHYLTAPYLGEGLSRQYQDAFLAVQRQFIEHFQEKGYRRTEMQCCFVGKAPNRIDFGTNSWWTTDEPYYWDDWLAVQFFLQTWARGRAAPTRASGPPGPTFPGRNGRGGLSTAWSMRSTLGPAGSARRPWSAAAGPWAKRPD